MVTDDHALPAGSCLPELVMLSVSVQARVCHASILLHHISLYMYSVHSLRGYVPCSLTHSLSRPQTVCPLIRVPFN